MNKRSLSDKRNVHTMYGMLTSVRSIFSKAYENHKLFGHFMEIYSEKEGCPQREVSHFLVTFSFQYGLMNQNSCSQLEKRVMV